MLMNHEKLRGRLDLQLTVRLGDVAVFEIDST